MSKTTRRESCRFWESQAVETIGGRDFVVARATGPNKAMAIIKDLIHGLIIESSPANMLRYKSLLSYC
jgi:hypothetical protein